ncbi:MAG: hydrogenase expression protein [Chloroflexi bacterium]|nr:hydrogenase expression protein [Chloroflexota bacterium]
MTQDKTAEALPVGKLPPDLLATFLRGLPARDPRVVVGARYGEDAAVVEAGGSYFVLAMDPITLSAEPGRLAVEVNANDIAVMGAEPRWLLATVILPPGVAASEAERVLGQVQERCSALDVSLIGGHTEVSPAVARPLVVACMVGEVAPDRLVTAAGMRPGDHVLLAGAIAVEGTGILARERAGLLRARGVSDELIREGATLLDSPGISILRAARALRSAAAPHAMHDPTEGGLLMALGEMAAAAGVGLRVEAKRVPLLPACRAFCRALDLEPLGLLASGSLLAALPPESVPGAIRALEAAGIQAAVIGSALPEAQGLVLVRDGQDHPLPQVDGDELARFLSREPSAES